MTGYSSERPCAAGNRPARRLALLIPVSIAVAAACHTTPVPAIPITGVLSSSSGSGAPLTAGQISVGNNFAMSATLGTNSVTGSGVWHCFAPAPPDFPNYDLQALAADNSFGFDLSIVTTAWTVGSHVIDSLAVSLLVTSPDAYGQATSGTLVLTTAGTGVDAGGFCAFHTSGAVPLFGFR